MLNERLQILITPEQRKRLEAEARRRGSSVATLVREAIDASLAGPTQNEREAAFEAICAMNGSYLSPAELEALVDEEREQLAQAARG